MFGDRIGLFTGSVEFLQTDVSIPGNGPEVAIKRRITSGTQAIKGLGMFGAWDMAIPSVHGLFSTQGGWRNYTVAEPLNRCSRYTQPADEVVSHALPTASGGVTVKKTFHAEEFWHGTFLYLPETGDEELVTRGSGGSWPTPTNGHTYVLGTKSGTAIRCIPTEDGTGEGFEATTPAGITYRFDHMAKGIGLTPLIKAPYDFSSSGPSYPTSDYEYVLYRQEFFLLPTLVTDRFGNTVTYTWDAQNPKQLTRIEASDGRLLEIAWSNGRVSQVKHGDKIWTYAGTRITLPDQSYWLVGSPVASSRGEGSVPADRSYCAFEGSPTTMVINTTMVHPSGAVANFTFRPILHGRSWTPYICRLGEPVPGDAYSGSYELSPARYYTWSLTSKTISGPGIAVPYSWTYTYGPHNGCYSGTSQGSMSCQSGAATTKWVDVLDPSGVTTRYTYGNQYNVNDGYLLSTSKPGQTTTHSYQLESPGIYPQYAGGVAHQKGVFPSKVIPLRERTIEQDGMKFTWRVNDFDSQARPISVVRSSAPASTSSPP
jgi:YD repeat-containing protein